MYYSFIIFFNFSQVSQGDIASMEIKVKDLQDKKTAIEKNFEDEMKALERKKKSLQQENSKLGGLIKEKEKEIRLNNLRLKELRKLTRFNAVQPIAGIIHPLLIHGYL